MTITLFEQRLTDEQRTLVLTWFPELSYDDTPGCEGFYDPDTGRFHRDYWFLNESGDIEERETIQLCILEKNRWMVDVIYACPYCGNSWVSAYIPQSLSCDLCQQLAQVTRTFEYFDRRPSQAGLILDSVYQVNGRLYWLRAPCHACMDEAHHDIEVHPTS